MQELKEKNKAMGEEFEGLKQELASLNIVQLRDENIELKKALNEIYHMKDYMEDFLAKQAQQAKKEEED